MFAGAAREAVFSRPEVIRRVNGQFIPLAVRATMANQLDPAGNADEERFYGRLLRTRAAPQGIVLLNADGQVLDWALTFQDDASVLSFLDYGLKRFHDFRRASGPVAARRYQQYPAVRMPDVPDEDDTEAIASTHPAGVPCPALSRSHSVSPPGSIGAELVGRTLDAAGKLSADTVRQEHYSEDQFSLPAEVAEAAGGALSGAGSEPVALPPAFGRLCATYAYLGHIDVRPLENPRSGTGELTRNELTARPVAGHPGSFSLRGVTEVTGDLPGGSGHHHVVKLSWRGFAEVGSGRLSRFSMLADGTETLHYGAPSPVSPSGKPGNEVACLPAGHPVDQSGRVRYGITGKLVPGTPPAPAPARLIADAPPNPDETARQLMAALGPQFALFLGVVQEDLKLMPEQRQHLRELLPRAAQGFQEFMRNAGSLPEAERGKKLQEFREGAHQNVGQVVSALLTPPQQARLGQIMLQQEGLFALLRPDVVARLELTPDQQKRAMATLEETQKRTEALQRKFEGSGKVDEMRKEGARVRQEQEAKLEKLLTEAQRKEWEGLLGKRLAL